MGAAKVSNSRFIKNLANANTPGNVISPFSMAWSDLMVLSHENPVVKWWILESEKTMALITVMIKLSPTICQFFLLFLCCVPYISSVPEPHAINMTQSQHILINFTVNDSSHFSALSACCHANPWLNEEPWRTFYHSSFNLNNPVIITSSSSLAAKQFIFYMINGPFVTSGNLGPCYTFILGASWSS